MRFGHQIESSLRHSCKSNQINLLYEIDPNQIFDFNPYENLFLLGLKVI